SKCHKKCGDSRIQFHLFGLDPSLPLPQNIAYFDNNSEISTPVDLVTGEGLFCPTIKYVETEYCDSGYIKFVSITPTYTGAASFTYEFYLECATNEEVSANPGLILGPAPDTDYARPGILVKKLEGKIFSVTDKSRM